MNPRQHLAPVLLLGALVFSVQARAQKEALKVDVLLVSVDIAVSDSNGQPVQDLAKDDFVVYEDGQLQEIRSLSPIDTPNNIILLFDRSISTRHVRPLIQVGVTQFLEKLRPQDQIVIAAFGRTVDTLLDWNGPEIELIPRALSNFVWKPVTNNFYEALEWAIKKSREVKDRKAVVVLTDGMDKRIMEMTGSLKFPGRGSIPKARVVPIEEDRSFQNVLRTISSNKVRFYFIVPSTQVAPKIQPDAPLVRMEQFAQASGGRMAVAKESGDIPALYERIAADSAESYTLNYASGKPKRDGVFRKIEVRAKRPCLQVRQSRTGYFMN